MTNRNDYRNWTREQVADDAATTFARMRLNEMLLSDYRHKDTGEPIPMFRLDYTKAVKRLGLQLVVADVTYSLDAEDNPILNEQGQPIIESSVKPAHDFSVNVKVEGKVDAFGTLIPKGKQYFINTLEPANRPFNESNAVDIARRLGQYVLTGEALIKDELGGGQNEQHRMGALVIDTLTGANLAPPDGIVIMTIDGVSVGAAGAIDTGKQKSATDDLGSDHTILPNPLTWQDYKDGTKTGYGPQSKQARVKILRELQGVCKRLALRMGGTNIKGSKYSGYQSSGNVAIMATHWGGLDELVNMAYAYIQSIPLKSGDTKKPLRPVKIWEVATAYALYLLKDSEPLPSIDSLVEYEFLYVDLDPLQEFLTDLEGGVQLNSGPLAAWCRDRAGRRDKDEASFAQVLRAMCAYFNGDEVTTDINRAQYNSKETGTSYFHLGGGDKGPAPKKQKAIAE